MDNKTVAGILNQIADILEIKQENKFKIIAYRHAAQIIENLPEDLKTTIQKGKLREIGGIGEVIASCLEELIKTNVCKHWEKIKKQIPRGVLNLLNLSGLGPRKVGFFYQKFDIDSMPKLKKLAKSHRLLKIKGWGEKSEKNILRAIEMYEQNQGRFLLGEIYPLAQTIVEKLKKIKSINQIEICGSFRRWKETVGDLDILITSKNPVEATNFFTTLDLVKKIIVCGPTKSQVVLKNGIKADLRVVSQNSFGAALHYFTGSKNHNIQIRKLALGKKLKINEYGVFKKNGKKFIKIGGEKEKDVFQAVGLPWIPPELREDSGEIKAAQDKSLPNLISLNDIQGDCHLHTNWSDGKNNILETITMAQKKGYKYIAITDHASPLVVTNGLNNQRALKYIRAIKAIRKKVKGIKILVGVEVDIKKNGDLYLPNKILEQMDLVIASIHSGFKMDRQTATQRLIKAIENPYVNIIAHPTGRIINERDGYPVDFDKISEKAKKSKVALEINAHWQRLDLDANQVRLAKENGVKMIISSDAHNVNSFESMKFGVAVARKGWLEKNNVINTWPLKNFLNFIKK